MFKIVPFGLPELPIALPNNPILESPLAILSDDNFKSTALKVITSTLESLGYGVSFTVLNAKNFGVPQNRERLFIVAWYKKYIDILTKKSIIKL